MGIKNDEILLTGVDRIRRCWWCGHDPEYVRYHDEEWGQPVIEDRRLFEKICLEGFQSGLSWLTILRKRDAFRESFADFDFTLVATFGKRDISRLLNNARIVRHRGKIEATINNAQRALELAAESGGLAKYFWQYEPKRMPAIRSQNDLMATTAESTAMSKDLKRRGWKFVGPTTCYAFMQSMGLVNDHVKGCKHHAVVAGQRRQLKRPAS